jgi:Domain of unknown function (DUF4252)
MKFAIPILLAILPLAAQDIKMPVGLDRLAAKASDVVDVSLDGALLQLASRFLSDKDPDEANVKRLVGGLKGVYVKSFEFEDRDQYKESDVEELRAQLRPPVWTRIVRAKSKKDSDNSEVYLKTDGGQISGLAIIVTEPRELTFINIIGSIRPEDIRDLGGHMGIPKIDIGPAKKDKEKDKEKDKKDDKEDNR